MSHDASNLLAPARLANLVAGSALIALLAAACSGPAGPYYQGGSGAVDPTCTFDPVGCAGLIGGRCAVDQDCGAGVCCRDKNCGPGTCTFLCKVTADCPPEMACEHGFCFLRCNDNKDCGPGQGCEHDHTICEYK
jgi:hypothetical protein